MPSRLIRPFTARATYRRWVHLILGAVLAVPYLAVAGLVLGPLLGLGFRLGLPPVAVGLVQGAFVVLAVLATGLLPATRSLSGAAAKSLLGLPESGDADTWPDRWRTVCWLVVHLALGSGIGLLTLIVPPFILLLFANPLLALPPELAGIALYRAFGIGQWWAPLVGLGLIVAGFHLVAVVGALLARVAPTLLGPSEHERLRQQVEELSERNRIASELHDSVGHVLNVVALQASAANRVLDSDPAFAREALAAIADSTRAALADLDNALGALRSSTLDESSLADLDDLIRSTELAGLEVRLDLQGNPGSVPPQVSREGYRVVREGLTNALRHAGRVTVAVRINISPRALDLEMTNPLGSAPAPRRGLGLDGIKRRARALEGHAEGAARGGNWQLQVHLPW
ncbi:sensor histidine kinase [Saccharopolyspora pogona]|uniref:sensor histidine kinase n=1 Tax=Saccharopolyspora pogona TaxID=333966 RepID=UPI001689BAA8|nr:histidine kinase [Saccharopolyspora pogona]